MIAMRSEPKSVVEEGRNVISWNTEETKDRRGETNMKMFPKRRTVRPKFK
jgi:hypothetical protein